MGVVQGEYRVHEEPGEQDRDGCEGDAQSGGGRCLVADLLQLRGDRQQDGHRRRRAQSQHDVAALVLDLGAAAHVGRGRARHHDPDGAEEDDGRKVEGDKQPRPFADARGEDEIGEEAQQDGENQPLVLAQVARAAGEAGLESGAFVRSGGHLFCA